MSDVRDRILDWLAWGNRGISSSTIATHMSGLPVLRWAYGGAFADGGHPHDAYDFERCHKLLTRFPEWRNDIVRMGTVSAAWRALATAWDELEALHALGGYEPLTTRIGELTALDPKEPGR